MRISVKKIRLIEMTAEEHKAFIEALNKAKDGQTVNYGEVKLDDGSFLGVAVTPAQVDVCSGCGQPCSGTDLDGRGTCCNRHVARSRK